MGGGTWEENGVKFAEFKRSLAEHTESAETSEVGILCALGMLGAILCLVDACRLKSSEQRGGSFGHRPLAGSNYL